MQIHRRDEWVNPAQPFTGVINGDGEMYHAPAFLGWSRIDDVVIHYPGVTGAIGTDPVAVLRNMHNDYLMNRGYALGYGFAVDLKGEVWEVRGDTFTNAANKGDELHHHVGWNDHSISILILVGQQDAANAAQVKTTNALIDELERRNGGPLNLMWHAQGQSTDCAGAGIIDQLQRGVIAAGLSGATGQPSTPRQPPPVIPNTPPPGNRPTDEEEDDMKIFDLAPGTPEFTRVVVSGRIRWVRGLAAEVLEKVDVDATEVQRDEFVALLRTFGTDGPSPFDGTRLNAAPDAELEQEWQQARR
jgi:hypothetical protein